MPKKPLKLYKALSIAEATEKDAIYCIKANNQSEFTMVVTDMNGQVVPLKDLTSSVQSLVNDDGTIQVEGLLNKTIRINPSLVSTINSALQSGDPVSSLLNDAGYLTLADLPTTFPPSAHTHPISDIVNLQSELDSKENIINKVDVISGNSSVEYPSENAVKTYVDSQITAITIPDATTTVKGKIKLAGDLSGTADLPTVPSLINKLDKDFSTFTDATLPLIGTELVAINQGGIEKKLNISEILSSNLFSPQLFTYTGGLQEFTTTNTIVQVLLVFRNGKQIDEFTNTTTIVTVTTPLLVNDEILVVYASQPIGLTPFYTKAEIDVELNKKANNTDVVHKTGDETIFDNKVFKETIKSEEALNISIPVLNSSFISPNLPSDLTQGYAWDGTSHYLIGTSKLSKRDASWAVVAENTNPLTGLGSVNHLGDGVFLGGFLYVPVESFPAVTGMRIAKYDATTLLLADSYDISAQNHECSAITTDGTILYVSSYLDGAKIWKYSLTGAFLGVINIAKPFTNNIQGLSFYNGDFYITEQTRLSKLSLDGVTNTFLGYLPGQIARKHRGGGLEVVAGIPRVDIIGATSTNIYYLNSTTTEKNVVDISVYNRTSFGLDIAKKPNEIPTEYSDVNNYELVLGSRATGKAPMIATRTDLAITTGMFFLALQNSDIARTAEADILFRTATESSGNIFPLTTTGNAFQIANGTTNLLSIARNGNATFLGTVRSPKLETVGGTVNQFVDGTGALQNKSQFQTALINPITGILTTNFIPKATGANTLGNSLLSESGTVISGAASLLKKSFVATNSSYTGFSAGEVGFGARASGDVPYIIARGNRADGEMLSITAISTNDVARTSVSDMSFRVGFTSTDALSNLTTTGLAFSFQNAFTPMLSITRSGRTLFNTVTDNGVDIGQFNGTVSGSPATLSNQFVTKAQLDAQKRRRDITYFAANDITQNTVLVGNFVCLLTKAYKIVEISVVFGEQSMNINKTIPFEIKTIDTDSAAPTATLQYTANVSAVVGAIQNKMYTFTPNITLPVNKLLTVNTGAFTASTQILKNCLVTVTLEEI